MRIIPTILSYLSLFSFSSSFDFKGSWSSCVRSQQKNFRPSASNSEDHATEVNKFVFCFSIDSARFYWRSRIKILLSYKWVISWAAYLFVLLPFQPKGVAVILLAGGKGKRMKSSTPKQFLPLLGKPVFLRSLDVFLLAKDISAIIVVLDESYRPEYQYVIDADERLKWADPGR